MSRIPTFTDQRNVSGGFIQNVPNPVDTQSAGALAQVGQEVGGLLAEIGQRQIEAENRRIANNAEIQILEADAAAVDAAAEFSTVEEAQNAYRETFEQQTSGMMDDLPSPVRERVSATVREAQARSLIGVRRNARVRNANLLMISRDRKIDTLRQRAANADTAAQFSFFRDMAIETARSSAELEGVTEVDAEARVQQVAQAFAREAEAWTERRAIQAREGLRKNAFDTSSILMGDSDFFGLLDSTGSDLARTGLDEQEVRVELEGIAEGAIIAQAVARVQGGDIDAATRLIDSPKMAKFFDPEKLSAFREDMRQRVEDARAENVQAAVGQAFKAINDAAFDENKVFSPSHVRNVVEGATEQVAASGIEGGEIAARDRVVLGVMQQAADLSRDNPRRASEIADVVADMGSPAISTQISGFQNKISERSGRNEAQERGTRRILEAIAGRPSDELTTDPQARSEAFAVLLENNTLEAASAKFARIGLTSRLQLDLINGRFDPDSSEFDPAGGLRTLEAIAAASESGNREAVNIAGRLRNRDLARSLFVATRNVDESTREAMVNAVLTPVGRSAVGLMTDRFNLSGAFKGEDGVSVESDIESMLDVEIAGDSGVEPFTLGQRQDYRDIARVMAAQLAASGVDVSANDFAPARRAAAQRMVSELEYVTVNDPDDFFTNAVAKTPINAIAFGLGTQAQIDQFGMILRGERGDFWGKATEKLGSGDVLPQPSTPFVVDGERGTFFPIFVEGDLAGFGRMTGSPTSGISVSVLSRGDSGNVSSYDKVAQAYRDQVPSDARVWRVNLRWAADLGSDTVSGIPDDRTRQRYEDGIYRIGLKWFNSTAGFEPDLSNSEHREYLREMVNSAARRLGFKEGYE